MQADLGGSVHTKAVFALVLLGAASSWSDARADSCVDLRTNAVYDCNSAPPESKPAGKANGEAESLRQQLRAALARADAREKARIRKLQAAIAAAGKACADGDTAGFERRMSAAERLATENEGAALDGIKQNCAGAAKSVARESAPAETDPTQAEQDAGTPGGLPQFGDGDRIREQAWSKLSPRCKALVNRMMQGADSGDREKLLSSYGVLRAECDRDLRALAAAADSDLPDRRLSPRASSALAKAMSSDPTRLIEAVPDRADDAAFDPGEVADFALGLLGALPAMRGFYAPAARGAAASHAGGVYRNSGSAPRAPPSRPSTITGTSR